MISRPGWFRPLPSRLNDLFLGLPSLQLLFLSYLDPVYNFTLHRADFPWIAHFSYDLPSTLVFFRVLDCISSSNFNLSHIPTHKISPLSIKQHRSHHYHLYKTIFMVHYFLLKALSTITPNIKNFVSNSKLSHLLFLDKLAFQDSNTSIFFQKDNLQCAQTPCPGLFWAFLPHYFSCLEYLFTYPNLTSPKSILPFQVSPNVAILPSYYLVNGKKKGT